MKILKTAVVGLGRAGWSNHVRRILARPDRFSLVAVVDVSQERLAEAKEKHGIAGYTDVAAMIREVRPDLVVVASPTHLHKDHACTAMELGCDVFLDKPMAPDYETACQIAQCARRTGRKLMIYQPHRMKAEPNQLKAILASGKLGKLYALHRNECSYNRRADWQAFRKFGGGMLNNYGAHYIDVALYVLNEKVNRLCCFTDTIASAGDADDVVKAIFRTESGVMLDVDIKQAGALCGPEWMLYGSTGAIISEVSPSGTPQFRLRWYDGSAVPPITASENLAAANRTYNHDVPLPWVEEVIEVDPSYAIDCYETVYDHYALDQPPFVPLEETLYVMDLIRRCHESAEETI